MRCSGKCRDQQPLLVEAALYAYAGMPCSRRRVTGTQLAPSSHCINPPARPAQPRLVRACRQKEYDGALRCYQRCLELAPEDALALSNSAAVYIELGQWEQVRSMHSVST